MLNKLTEFCTEIPDTLLVAPSDEPEKFHFDIMTPKFIGRSNTNEPILITSIHVNPSATSHPFTFKTGDGTELFDKHKLLDLQGRYIEVATFNYYPYSSYEEVVPGTGNCNSQELMLNAEDPENYPEKTLVLDGTESLLALELCRIFNCTLLFVPGEHQYL